MRWEKGRGKPGHRLMRYTLPEDEETEPRLDGLPPKDAMATDEVVPTGVCGVWPGCVLDAIGERGLEGGVNYITEYF